MKNLAVVALCIIFAVAVWARPEEKYTSEYDNIDLDPILENDRARRGYINCLKTGKKCTTEGQLLRDIVPDALQTGCSKCTEPQKAQAKKVLDYTLKHHPEEFEELEAIYDPHQEYRNKYAEDLKKEHVVLPD